MTTAKELAKQAADLQLVIAKYLPARSRSAGVCPDAEGALTEAKKVFAERGIHRDDR